jgi:uncharacterized protein YbdZ (MbtH family)
MSQEYKSIFDREDVPFVIVVNAAGAVSIWPASREIPEGWERRGEAAPRAECLARIEAGLGAANERAGAS